MRSGGRPFTLTKQPRGRVQAWLLRAAGRRRRDAARRWRAGHLLLRTIRFAVARTELRRRSYRSHLDLQVPPPSPYPPPLACARLGFLSGWPARLERHSPRRPARLPTVQEGGGEGGSPPPPRMWTWWPGGWALMATRMSATACLPTAYPIPRLTTRSHALCGHRLMWAGNVQGNSDPLPSW